MTHSTRRVTVATAIAGAVLAIRNCEKANNLEWLNRHKARLDKIVANYMPSGSGVDCGTKLDLDASTEERLVFDASFHHMDESGSYDGWTEHRITVRASLYFGLTIRIGGSDRNQVKADLHERFEIALKTLIEEFPE